MAGAQQGLDYTRRLSSQKHPGVRHQRQDATPSKLGEGNMKQFLPSGLLVETSTGPISPEHRREDHKAEPGTGFSRFVPRLRDNGQLYLIVRFLAASVKTRKS